ncbi:MAG: cache domain-containing protein [Candidatus Krumholzibacteriia bacterium]
MNRKILTLALAAAVLLLAAVGAYAQDDPEALAAASAEYCNSTATDAMTSPDVIVAKVKEACAVLEAEGTAAFPKFQGKGSPFLFAGTYMWIHTLDDGTMLMHPMKYKLNGKNVLTLKDTQGKRFFATMNDVVKESGEGWVDYYWPKPGTDEIVHKVSYVRGCTTPDGKALVVGCGLYKFDDSTVASLTIK